MLTLLALFMMSCASSSQVGKTSSWNDEIYGSTSKPQTSQLAQNKAQSVTPEKKVNSNYANLEQKYSDVIEINMDSIKNDTVIYRAEDTNPYSRILSDSYQESYERRLRGLSDPYYGMNNWSTYYSDDYWYAQAYDPAFYNIVVMGGQVWVEPWYISNMFGYPTSNFYFGFGFTWALPSWHYYNWYNCGGNYWAYNYHPWYGRRSAGTTDNTITRRNTSAISGVTGRQTGISGRGEGSKTSGTNPIVSTRNTQTRVTPTYESGSRSGSRGSQVAVTRREGSSRSERPTREIGVSEPTRRTYNQTNERTRTSTDYSARRNEGSQNSNVSGTSRSNSGNRGATPTYNRPERVSSPTTSSSRSNDSYRQSGSDNRSSSSGSTYSGSTSRSSSSSGSSSGSNSNSRRR